MVVSTMDPGLWICYCVDHTRLLYEFPTVFVNAFSRKISVFYVFHHKNEAQYLRLCNLFMQSGYLPENK